MGLRLIWRFYFVFEAFNGFASLYNTLCNAGRQVCAEQERERLSRFVSRGGEMLSLS